MTSRSADVFPHRTVHLRSGKRRHSSMSSLATTLRPVLKTPGQNRYSEAQVRVSAYPLALWIASSWWRLRWEPLPFRASRIRRGVWLMRCQARVTAIFWPLLTFASDGEAIDAICRPSNPLSTEPVCYVAGFHDAIEAHAFERALDDFISLVLARLDAVGLSGTDLRLLWDEVLAERADPSATLRRTLEAKLGFEPDESPDALISRLLSLSEQAGTLATEEIAPAC